MLSQEPYPWSQGRAVCIYWHSIEWCLYWKEMKYAPKGPVLGAAWLPRPHTDSSSKKQRSSRGLVQCSCSQWHAGGTHTAHPWESTWGKTNPSEKRRGDTYETKAWECRANCPPRLDPFWVDQSTFLGAGRGGHGSTRLVLKSQSRSMKPSSHFFPQWLWFCSKTRKRRPWDLSLLGSKKLVF